MFKWILCALLLTYLLIRFGTYSGTCRRVDRSFAYIATLVQVIQSHFYRVALQRLSPSAVRRYQLGFRTIIQPSYHAAWILTTSSPLSCRPRCPNVPQRCVIVIHRYTAAWIEARIFHICIIKAGGVGRLIWCTSCVSYYCAAIIQGKRSLLNDDGMAEK